MLCTGMNLLVVRLFAPNGKERIVSGREASGYNGLLSGGEGHEFHHIKSKFLVDAPPGGRGISRALVASCLP